MLPSPPILWLRILIASSIALASVAPLIAETKSRKKTDAEETPSPRKKSARAKTTPEPEPENTPTPNHDIANTKRAAEKATPSPEPMPSSFAPNVSLDPPQLLEFRAQPAAVKKLIEACLELARQNLTYTYGSSDPANGGLD